MNEQPLIPRPAATLILVRDGQDGIEVFLMQRTHKAAFVPGGYVFPGGAVDPADSDNDFGNHCAGMDDVSASRLLGTADGGLAYWVAAIRECFEEAGILLARDSRERMLDLVRPQDAAAFAMLRQQVATGELPLAEVCRSRGLRLALDQLVYFGHWVTPAGAPRRFDTRFFVAVAPERQVASSDNVETIGHAWIRPAEALERHRAGELDMMFATVRTLESLSRFSDTGALMRHARALQSIPTFLPRVSRGREGRRVLIQGDPAYAEVGKLDPLGKGTTFCEIHAGAATRLSANVVRVTAPNPGFMTGPGTNSYLVGTGDGIAVIDPGPADLQHVERLLEHAAGTIRWILTTHTHMDHSPAALLLQAKTGAKLLGMPPPVSGPQDQGYLPDIVLADDQRIEAGNCMLRVIHTPGHASNHLCYLLEAEGILFTGDHIMQGSTVVINPPDGDMAAYLASLRKVKDLSADYLAPGHGFLMDKPHVVVDRLLAHRMTREEKVLAALRRLGPSTVDELLPAVYDDVPEKRYAMAARSLLAHLLKVAAEGRVVEDGGRWALQV